MTVATGTARTTETAALSATVEATSSATAATGAAATTPAVVATTLMTRAGDTAEVVETIAAHAEGASVATEGTGGVLAGTATKAVTREATPRAVMTDAVEMTAEADPEVTALPNGISLTIHASVMVLMTRARKGGQLAPLRAEDQGPARSRDPMCVQDQPRQPSATPDPALRPPKRKRRPRCPSKLLIRPL
jgi:hypothetical protein